MLLFYLLYCLQNCAGTLVSLWFVAAFTPFRKSLGRRRFPLCAVYYLLLAALVFWRGSTRIAAGTAGKLLFIALFLCVQIAMILLLFEGRAALKLMLFGFNALLEMLCMVLSQLFWTNLQPALYARYLAGGQGSLWVLCTVESSETLLFALLTGIAIRMGRQALKGVQHSSAWLALVPLSQLLLLVFYAADTFSVDGSDSLNGKYLWGMLLGVIVSCFGDTALFSIVARLRENARLQQQLQAARLQQQYYALLEQQQTEIREMRHDMQNHLNLILQTLSSGGQAAPELASYLRQYAHHAAANLPVVELYYCGEPALNALLVTKMQDAAALGVTLRCRVEMPGKCCIDAFDAVTMLSNMLDNALEAAAAAAGKKEVELGIRQQGSILTLVCENPLPAPGASKVHIDADKGSHGNGSRIIRRTAARYGGRLQCINQNGRFSQSLVLNAMLFPADMPAPAAVASPAAAPAPTTASAPADAPAAETVQV